ncbi:MAG: ATP-binding protein [Pseudomonas marincola]
MKDDLKNTPFGKRIAFKQARIVVLVSLFVGLLLSLLQIYIDFQTESHAVEDTILQVVNTVHQPAARAAYHLDIDLAEEVASGLFKFKSITAVSIFDDARNELTSQVRSEEISHSNPLTKYFSEFAFGNQRIHEILLRFSEDDTVNAGKIRVVIDTELMAVDFFNRSVLVIILDVLRNFILAIIVSFIFYYLIAKPLHLMEKEISKFDPDNPKKFRMSVPKRNQGDEFHMLANSVNELFREIAQRNNDRNIAEYELQKTASSLEITVTERTAELQRTLQKAETANKVKTDFLAAMSHEIRTPMAGVIGMANLMLDSNLSKQQRNWTDNIRTSGENLLTILNEILDQSKLEAGKLQISAIDFDLFKLVNDNAQLFAPKITEKGLDLEINLQNNLPRFIKADSLRIGQILSNLLSNALKFTSSGKITIQVTHHVGAKMLRIAVTDSGIGLTKLAQKNIFQAFTQADNSTARNYGGTGLGLSISKKLAELMGGEIAVESKPEVGSTFWFTVAFETAQESAETSPNDKRPITWHVSRPLRILLAEDNLVNQQIMIAFLEKYKHEVTVAENGKIAVEKANSNIYDLILMDVRMPVMDGLEATKHIRSLNTPNSRIPIIAVTADVAKSNVEDFLKAGMTDVCSKPPDLPTLFKMINKHLGEEIHMERISKQSLNLSSIN